MKIDIWKKLLRLFLFVGDTVYVSDFERVLKIYYELKTLTSSIVFNVNSIITCQFSSGYQVSHWRQLKNENLI